MCYVKYGTNNTQIKMLFSHRVNNTHPNFKQSLQISPKHHIYHYFKEKVENNIYFLCILIFNIKVFLHIMFVNK